MKFPKFSVLTKILCASALSSYITYSYVTVTEEEMATKSCADECRSRAQKLKLYCPPAKNFIVTGNWKMNGDKKLAEEIIKLIRCGPIVPGNDIVIGIPAPYLDYFQQRKPKVVEVASQNIYKESKGPYTGEISADMLIDIGVKWVILGASERRMFFNEDYDFIGEKAKYALEKNLKLVICIGENAGERECKEHVKVVIEQLETLLRYIPKSKWKHLVLAYEPLWTVGTGKAITVDEATEMALAIREWATKTIDEDSANLLRIQVGGPLTPTTGKTFARRKELDGLYIGAPSLKPEFIALVNANAKEG
ncbi:triosephosphate isomerase-like [Coccinella septempunctata]|uniref:triosephosphate isomerase-like n=1 Tax=Coccinella septempunctata TaxID=41139 RepID=UPI001D06BE1D|nr:triosephosphate isomerase-like [Coccinella septempunctata]